MANEHQVKNDELVVAHTKLLGDFEHLKNGSRDIESVLTKLTESHEQLVLPSPLDIVNDDACATNSTSCEASILKENVELRDQLDLLASDACKMHT